MKDSAFPIQPSCTLKLSTVKPQTCGDNTSAKLEPHGQASQPISSAQVRSFAVYEWIMKSTSRSKWITFSFAFSMRWGFSCASLLYTFWNNTSMIWGKFASSRTISITDAPCVAPVLRHHQCGASQLYKRPSRRASLYLHWTSLKARKSCQKEVASVLLEEYARTQIIPPTSPHWMLLVILSCCFELADLAFRPQFAQEALLSIQHF